MSRFTVIDLSQLPTMQVLEQLSSEDILNARMAKFVELWKLHDPPAGAVYDVNGLEFDPVKINQELNSFNEVLVRDRVNQAARAITLAFAIGGDLDAIASRYPGGVPRLLNESDERYRKRIWLSVNALSPHGTAEAYQYWGLTALGGALRDVSTLKIRASLAENPTILITCLAQGAEPKPTQAQLLEVRRYIQDEHREGLTDDFTVAAPKVLETKYRIRVWLYPGPDATMLLDKMRVSLTALINKQYWLGYDHTRMAIDAACALAGVHHVDIIEPATDLMIEPDWVVRVTNVSLELAGRTE